MIDVIPEPEHEIVADTSRSQQLKTSCIIDRASYDCAMKQMDFKPTLIYACLLYTSDAADHLTLGLSVYFTLRYKQTV